MGGWLSYLEPEEFIGSHWHRLTGRWSSLPRYPAAAVAYAEVAPSLPVFFRGLGGPAALRLGPCVSKSSGHRLGPGVALALGLEKLALARREENAVWLPDVIDAFPDRAANRGLYFWLAAFFAHMGPANVQIEDPLRRDLDFLRRAHAATRAVVAHGAGMARLWEELSRSLRAVRPARRLPEVIWKVVPLLSLPGAC